MKNRFRNNFTKLTLAFILTSLAFILSACERTGELNGNDLVLKEDVLEMNNNTFLSDEFILELEEKNEEMIKPEGLIWPVPDFLERINKKSFGTFITSETSPVQPEKFSGFHTGVDVEFNDIDDIVIVVAVTDGEVIYANRVNGYGGVAIVRHEIDDKEYYFLYGHLQVSSLPKVGDKLKAGEKLAVLGEAYSSDTDRERKHLHLSVYLSDNINLRGYVNTEAELSAWVNPLMFFIN